MNPLDEFDFSAASRISAKQVQALAEASYLEHAELVISFGDSGAGKTRLASEL